MNISVKQMAKIKGVNERTIRRWIEKGYWPRISQGKNGACVLPDNLPTPYQSKGKIERDSALLKCFIDASDLGQIVHLKMFPRFSDERFNRMLSYAEENHLVERRIPYTGIIQLVSTAEGRAIISAEPKDQKKILDKVLQGIPAVVALAEFGIQYGPQILEAISNAATTIG